MSILLIAGSPSEQSRSGALLDAVAARLEQRHAEVARLNVRELPASALLLADFSHPEVKRVTAQVEQAEVLVVSTPVYKAAYSGTLKVFLDLLPQTALKGKTVLPLATGGSPHHMLALDYALRPVLQSLGARHILPGVYASDAQVPRDPLGAYRVDDEVQLRLDDAVDNLVREGLRRPAATAAFEPVHFSQVRCSV
jgi:FMN reductase